MSYGVSITQDGTVLQTAGKYVDQDIVVGMSDSIKLPAQTFNPSTVDQVIPAGKFLSGAQTVKACAGTKTIAENGTHSVVGFASAAVNVIDDRFRQWTYTSSGSAENILTTIISSDEWVKRHYNDPNLVVVIKPKFHQVYGNGLRSVLFMLGGNYPYARKLGWYLLFIFNQIYFGQWRS